MIELKIDSKIYEIIERDHIEKSQDAYSLIEQAISLDLPIDKIFSRYNGNIEGNNSKVTKIRISDENELENGIYNIRIKGECYRIAGKEKIGWYVRKRNTNNKGE